MLRTFLRYFVGLLAICGLAVACWVPFLFPTQTLWYKFGFDKQLLLAGHICGVLAFYLLLLQLLLGVRIRLLVSLYSVRSLNILHRVLGPAVVLLALSHAALILLPEGIDNLPLGLKFWPEMVGGALLGLFVVQVLSSSLRHRLPIHYRTWRKIHRGIAYFGFLLGIIHIIFLSDAFGWAWPGRILTGVCILVLVLIVDARLNRQ